MHARRDRAARLPARVRRAGGRADPPQRRSVPARSCQSQRPAGRRRRRPTSCTPTRGRRWARRRRRRERMEVFGHYQVNDGLMAAAGAGCDLHALPAGLSRARGRGRRDRRAAQSRVIRQGHNRHARRPRPARLPARACGVRLMTTKVQRQQTIARLDRQAPGHQPTAAARAAGRRGHLARRRRRCRATSRTSAR